MTALEKCSAATFEPLLNDLFQIRRNGEDVPDLKLVHVKVVGKRDPDQFGNAFVLPATIREEAFSVVFCGPAQRPLPQDTYEFDHPAIGKFALFIVPIGADADGRYYEAVFG